MILNKPEMIISYQCLVCKEKFPRKKELAIHLDKHQKGDMITVLSRWTITHVS